MTNLKEQLYKMCIEHVQKRIGEARQAIDDAQDSSDEETKSSAGDKYETSREMMQQVADRAQVQVNEANKLMVALSTIAFNTSHSTVDTGSVVYTNHGQFYIAISAGVLNVGQQAFYAVSPGSPIGIQLNGKKAGDEFDLNGRAYKIEKVI